MLEAFKYLNNYVKSRLRATQADGNSLMKEAFSPRHPILRLNELLTPSDKDEQLGYMEIFSGVMTGIRNPRAHENDFDNDPFIAIRLLSLADRVAKECYRMGVSADMKIVGTVAREMGAIFGGK